MRIWAWHMIRFGAEHFSKIFVGLIFSIGAAQADSWSAFEQRCLIPFEHQSLSDISGLEAVHSENGLKRYEIIQPDGETLELELEDGPDDGLRACTVSEQSPSALADFEVWIAAMVADERYIEVEEGRWQSNYWIEPVLEIQLLQRGDALGLRIVETDLES